MPLKSVRYALASSCPVIANQLLYVHSHILARTMTATAANVIDCAITFGVQRIVVCSAIGASMEKTAV